MYPVIVSNASASQAILAIHTVSVVNHHVQLANQVHAGQELTVLLLKMETVCADAQMVYLAIQQVLLDAEAMNVTQTMIVQMKKLVWASDVEIHVQDHVASALIVKLKNIIPSVSVKMV